LSATPDPKFGLEILTPQNAANIRVCIQCGKCSSVCPLVRHREHYSPIEVIKSVTLGLKDIVLSSDEICCALPARPAQKYVRRESNSKNLWMISERH